MRDGPKDVLKDFVLRLNALRDWAGEEKVKQFEPILGESLCDEALERIEENLRKLIETEEYRFLISGEGIKRLKEIGEKLDIFKLFHFRYGMKEKAEVGVDG